MVAYHSCGYMSPLSGLQASVRPLSTLAVITAAAAMFACIGALFPGVAHAADKANDRISALSWPGFQIIMWQTKTAAQYESLARLGVTAARVQADRAGETKAVVAAKLNPIEGAGLKAYVENIATDFYAPYHRWFPDHSVNWKFLEAKRLFADDPSSDKPFIREPGLSDAAVLARIRHRLRETVRAYSSSQPLFFNLADEAGIADLTAFWDFDLSSPSIAGFRRWLKRQYPSLAALNGEWSTNFHHWVEATPQNTTPAMQRADSNYARWSDFKAWMDVAFARAVRAGSAALHAGAPWARSGLEGVQMPGWGGYDYGLLAGSVDVMEISGDNVAWEIMRSLDPHVTLLSTSSLATSGDEHELWERVLLGSRGIILWDESQNFVREDGSAGPHAEFAKRVFSELQGPIGKLLVTSDPVYDPIAILYSPASFRLQWMVDHRAGGSAWTSRGADTEDEDNSVRHATRAALDGLERSGFHPRFITEPQIRAGALQRLKIRILILPDSLAISRGLMVQLRNFVSDGGSLAIIGRAGLFDEHGKALENNPLSQVTLMQKNAINLPIDDETIQAMLAKLAACAGLEPLARVRAADADSIHVYISHAAKTTILALQSELDPNSSTETSRTTTADLRRPLYAYNVSEQRDLGRVSHLDLLVRSGMPTVIILGDIHQRVRN